MKKFISFYLKAFFDKKLDLRVRMFHVLAITGFIICVTMTGVSIAGGMVVSTIINMGAGFTSLFLLFYSAKKGNYQFCYIATIVVIFFILFPSLFFSGGGYKGGMPFFFMFAVVFTVYMLDGWKMVIISIIEMIFYSILCVQAYKNPQWIIPFASEEAVVVDVVICLIAVSVSLGATMFIQMRMYQKQQEELKKAQEDAETANRAKSAFLANMSHEIRTPIHMILGVNEIILRESRGKQIREYSRTIDETSKMLLSLVDSILDVSKIESGKMELIEAPYESINLIRTLALIGRTHCGKKKLKFSCHVTENIPSVLVGDLPHIQQIVTNFLSNAAKYTEAGSVILTIFQEPLDGEDQINLCISVEDTGIGISKDAIPTLFDAFIRADLGAHRHIAGTGLGLAIVKELTDLMHGKIFVESDPGVGSTFTVKIPQRIIKESTETEKRQSITFQAPDAHMLVVDDNEGNRSIMKELLLPTGIQMDLAESGEKCLELTREKEYHLILMDYMMPGMNGLETLEKLKRRKEFCVPVVALTADATSDTREKLMAGGFSGCLTKPIPLAKLHEELLKFIPKELITILHEEEKDEQNEDKIHEIEAEMLAYGISIEDGLQFFRNDLEEYCAVAQVFLGHDQEERREVRKLCEAAEWNQLSFRIHALKGKARNLGMGRLADTCAYMENICIADNTEEIQSLIPYLMYLWKRGTEGLKFLLRKTKRAEKKAAESEKNDCECQEKLLEFLRELRRRPALECVETLLKEEADPEGRERLEDIQRLVNGISFEEAEEAFKSYQRWKKGEHTK